MTKPFDRQSKNVSFADKVCTWNDLVLPSDITQQLMEVADYVKHYAEVSKTWSLVKLSHAHAIGILFSGPSGTGKTLAAEVIANELKRDLYKVDLLKVVSKYIGETEKNLAQIFSRAEQSNAILFFDEADALFGKRNNIKDSHDRYATIEITYFLERMEKHSGVIIFTINSSEDVYTAFLRRMNFIVEFPFPTKECRREIWKKMLEKKTNFGPEDIETLSLLPLTGENIKSIVSSTTSLLNDSCTIQASHIIEAYVRLLLNAKLSEHVHKTNDLGSMLVELLLYVGDELSKFQDAVAEEAYLDTSRKLHRKRRRTRINLMDQ